MAKKFFIGNTELATSSDVANAVADKQDTLVSGTNIKTINNTSVLGSGNINIESGLTEVKASDIDSESATNGQVLMADGNGDASWQSVSSGSSNYNDLTNKPIINQDLGDVGFTPTNYTYYRHTGNSSGFGTFENGNVLLNGWVIHFEVKDVSTLRQYIEDTYQQAHARVDLVSTSNNTFKMYIDYDTNNGIYVLWIEDKNVVPICATGNGNVGGISVKVGFNNLDANGNYTLDLASATTITNVDTKGNETDD